MRWTYLIAMVALLIECGAVQAHNLWFMPGDAFFPTWLTAESLEQIQAKEPPEFVVSHGPVIRGGGGFGCGYIGYNNAKFPAVDRPFIRNLAYAYALVRKKEPAQFRTSTLYDKEIRQEINGVLAMLYPRDFDITRFTIGVTYNEQFAAEVFKFTKDKRLPAVSKNDKAAGDDSHRDDEQVGTFKTTVPDVEPRSQSGFAGIIEQPVILEGAVQAFVLIEHGQDPTKIPSEGTRILRVDSKEIFEYRFDHGKWARLGKIK